MSPRKKRFQEPDDKALCGSTKRQGEGPCRLRAGYGTDHFGVGRCKFHGGSVPVKHGRYSTILRRSVRQLAESFESDPDPLNLLPELAQARALYTEYVNKCEKDPKLFSPSQAAYLLSEVSKAAKRIEDIHAQSAISRRDFYRVMTEMGRIVDMVVEDPKLRERIQNLWGGIKLA